MSGTDIPERDPVGDTLTGSLLQAEQTYLLAPKPLPNTEVIASGELIARYGLRYLGRPHLAVVPGLIALDYGAMFTGEEAYEFVLKKSNLYPRSEVIGYRSDGVDEMIVFKMLDLALTPMVLVYPDATATTPLAAAEALIATEQQATTLPARVTEYLPRYDTLAQWQADDDS